MCYFFGKEDWYPHKRYPQKQFFQDRFLQKWFEDYWRWYIETTTTTTTTTTTKTTPLSEGCMFIEHKEYGTLEIECPGIPKSSLKLEITPKYGDSAMSAEVHVHGKSPSKNKSIDLKLVVANVNAGACTAVYQDGVLTVTLPKASPKVDPISVAIQ